MEPLRRPGLGRGDARAEDDRAWRARRRELDDPEVLADDDVGVEPPPQAHVETLGSINVGHGDDDDLQLHVDRSARGRLGGGFTSLVDAAHVDLRWVRLVRSAGSARLSAAQERDLVIADEHGEALPAGGSWRPADRVLPLARRLHRANLGLVVSRDAAIDLHGLALPRVGVDDDHRLRAAEPAGELSLPDVFRGARGAVRRPSPRSPGPCERRCRRCRTCRWVPARHSEPPACRPVITSFG